MAIAPLVQLTVPALSSVAVSEVAGAADAQGHTIHFKVSVPEIVPPLHLELLPVTVSVYARVGVSAESVRLATCSFAVESTLSLELLMTAVSDVPGTVLLGPVGRRRPMVVAAKAGPGVGCRHLPDFEPFDLRLVIRLFSGD